MPVASMGWEVNSMPAKTRFVYSLASSPSTWTSAWSASSHTADHVSTVSSV